MNRVLAIVRCLVLGGGLSVILAGCATPSPEITYFSLLDGLSRPTSLSNTNGFLLSVGPVTLPEGLKHSEIVTGGRNGEFVRSEYHRWSGDIDLDFARALAERLSVDLGTEHIVVFPWNMQLDPTCQVLVDVLALDGDLGENAELSVRWILIDRKGGQAPVFRASHFMERPGDGGYSAWVHAQQRNIERLGEEMATAIGQRFPLRAGDKSTAGTQP